MNDASSPVETFIVVADGSTDYLLLRKVIQEDQELAPARVIKMIAPEDVGLTRRTGGGHRTLLRDLGIALIRAAQGYADGVFALVDNDGDARFHFPHDRPCQDCRECEAWAELEKVKWGKPVKKGAAILYQAAETIPLSARAEFSPAIEEGTFSDNLKRWLYGRHIEDKNERYEAFAKELEKMTVSDIKARCYPRLKKTLIAMINT
ncbi:MAG: hypothetical protein ABSB94_21105 [Syntrophorhabdales bacterium]|jgi:hypothetical protein